MHKDIFAQTVNNSVIEHFCIAVKKKNYKNRESKKQKKK